MASISMSAPPARPGPAHSCGAEANHERRREEIEHGLPSRAGAEPGRPGTTSAAGSGGFLRNGGRKAVPRPATPVGSVPHRDDAAQLELKPDLPVLYIERRAMLEDGVPLAFVTSRYRGGIYDVIVELNPAADP